MESGINNYQEVYEEAYKAYVQANYEEAASLIDKVLGIVPENANIHLLRGNIYYILQQFDIAKSEYESIIKLGNEQEIIDLAQNGLRRINQHQRQQLISPQTYLNCEISIVLTPMGKLSAHGDVPQGFASIDIDDSGIISLAKDNYNKPADNEDLSSIPLDLNINSNVLLETSSIPKILEDDNNPSGEPARVSKNLSGFLTHESKSLNSEGKSLYLQEFQGGDSLGNQIIEDSLDDENLLIKSLGISQSQRDSRDKPDDRNIFQAYDDKHNKTGLSHIQDISQNSSMDSINDSFDFEVFESAFGPKGWNNNDEETSNPISFGLSQGENIEFLEDFDEFDDLGDIPRFNVPKNNCESSLHSAFLENPRDIFYSSNQENVFGGQEYNIDNKLFSINDLQQGLPLCASYGLKKIGPDNAKQSLFATLENTFLHNRPWLIGGAVGIASAIFVASVSLATTSFVPLEQRQSVRNIGWAMALAAGISSAMTTGVFGTLGLRRIRRTTKDLQSQFYALRHGNLGVTATIYSGDEFGQLATSFNKMVSVISTTINEANRKAQEQEEAKENLQHQAIRLLDDVEVAARGDLTVQAEVTADILGAVANAFNLTIQNLSDVAIQVKINTDELAESSTSSETFVRALSSNSLRQVEELTTTLHSVQFMTNSIQRVTEASGKAAFVTHNANEIAQKGRKVVENTMAGILEMRKMVAETTRKVKRLTESSQEISMVVALISQIASRSDLLALNASIEAARAGEVGKGFAIIADEVRQLADKSANSLKAIEHIEIHIQNETESIMTAMEKEKQQVIKGVKLAEDAQQSLDNIIRAAKTIDQLVYSISSEAISQRETSRTITQLMQSMELNARETSKEAERVSGTLQNLVIVSQDLISSVENLRVGMHKTQ